MMFYLHFLALLGRRELVIMVKLNVFDTNIWGGAILHFIANDCFCMSSVYYSYSYFSIKAIRHHMLCTFAKANIMYSSAYLISYLVLA